MAIFLEMRAKILKRFPFSPQVAFEITGSNKKCTVGFSTPKEVWTHYVLTYRTLDYPNSIGVFLNGEEVTNFAFKECSDGNFAEENFTRISIGGPDALGGNRPETAFDEIIIWYKNLSREDIYAFYNYYKGKSLGQYISFSSRNNLKPTQIPPKVS